MSTTDHVCAVIVTRGDVDVEPILSSLPRDWEKVVWSNKGTVRVDPGDDEPLHDRAPHGAFFTHGKGDLSVYGRYEAIQNAASRLIYVQDDDCVLEPESFDLLLAKWQPSYVVCNMPAPFRVHYSDSALVGFGALFERDLPLRAFERFEASGVAQSADPFLRCCDVVFTTLTPRTLVDVPYTNLPHATGPDRMYRQPTHVGERRRMLELARQVRDA